MRSSVAVDCSKDYDEDFGPTRARELDDLGPEMLGCAGGGGGCGCGGCHGALNDGGDDTDEDCVDGCVHNTGYVDYCCCCCRQAATGRAWADP